MPPATYAWQGVDMKDVSKDELSNVQGGADLVGTVADTLPCPVPNPTTATTLDGSLLPPTLPQKHVET